MSNQPLKPNKTRNIIIAVLAVVIILGLFTGLWLILSPSGPAFAFMKTDEFNVVSVIFGGTSSNASNYINMTIENIGAASFTFHTAAQVNGISKPLAAQVFIKEGYSAIVTIPNVNWNDGQQYSIVLLTTSGDELHYVANAHPGDHSPNPYPSPPNPNPNPSSVDSSPLLKVAPFIALIVFEALLGVVLVGVIFHDRKHSKHDVRARSVPADYTVLVILIPLGLFIAFFLWWLLFFHLSPLTFSWILAPSDLGSLRSRFCDDLAKKSRRRKGNFQQRSRW